MKLVSTRIGFNSLFLPFFFLLSIFLTSDFSRFGVGFDFIIVFLFVITINFFLHLNTFPISSILLLNAVSIPTLVLSTINGDVLNALICVMILLVPFSLSVIRFNDGSVVVGSYFTFAISFAILILWQYYGFLRSWNFNTISILMYFGLSSASIFISNDKSKIWAWLMYISSAILMLNTESRNTSIAIVVTLILLIAKRVACNKVMFRIIYIIAVSFSYLFLQVADFIANNQKIYNVLLEISVKYFGKATIFNGRIPIFRTAENLIHDSFLEFLFGHGKVLITFFHAHNNYYQAVYLFGIVGTILISIMFAKIFEMAYILVKSGDSITYGIFCILIGNFIQLGGENFLVGTTLLTLMPFVYMAIIISRYKKYSFTGEI